jgi:hypothetical protein
LGRKRKRSIRRSKLAISKSGLNFDLPATQVSAVGEQLRNLFSPVVEGAGLIGDYIRFFRQAATIRAMQRVQVLAEQQQLKLRPVPPKVIVPWVEGVSLEDPTSPLIDWWANLLVHGASGASLRPYIIELMKQIGPDEATFLETLWAATSKGSLSNISGTNFVQTDVITFVIWSAFELRMKALSLGQPFVRGKEELVTKADKLTGDAITEFLKWAEQQGTPARMKIKMYSGGVYWPSSQILTSGSQVDVACALNLVSYATSEQVVTDGFGQSRAFEMRVLRFTQLGIEFMTACQPIRLVEMSKTNS